MIGIISLLLILYILLFFTRIATIILIHTGLPENVARFQSRSAVTGCGFTTSESEQITGNLVRRRVVSNLMLLGNIGIIASISSLLLSMVTVDHEHLPQSLGARLLLLTVGLLVMWRISRQRWFERLTILLFEFFTRTKLEAAAFRLHTLCRLPGNYRICDVYLAPDSTSANQTTAQFREQYPAVRLLGVNRGVNTYLDAPPPAEILTIGDSLIVYGPDAELEKLIRANHRHPGAKS